MADDILAKTEQLKLQLSQMLMGLVHEPVQQAVNQIPVILSRTDLTDDQKVEIVEHLQLAIVAPFIGGAVNAAQACRMELGVFLNLNGHAWEEIRSQLMATVGAEMLNRAPKASTDG